MTIWWLSYPLLGIFGGFVAGLFGVGGGLTLVPFMYMLFVAQNFPPEHVMHLALGTSMATIVFTSLSSMRAHHAHGAVRWDVVRSLAPGLVLGTFGGSLVAGQVPTGPMTAIFVVIVYYASLQMMLDFKPKAHRQLPGPLGLFSVGGGIGVISSLVAAGGGFCPYPSCFFAMSPFIRPLALRRHWAFRLPWRGQSATSSPAGAILDCHPTRWAISTCRPLSG